MTIFAATTGLKDLSKWGILVYFRGPAKEAVIAANPVLMNRVYVECKKVDQCHT